MIFLMIGAFWNVRGLNKDGRMNKIAEFIKKHQLDFVGFQETKKENFDQSFLQNISGTKDFCWKWLHARKTSGGILVGFDSSLFDFVSC